jgi:hypothetical protein
LHKDKRKTPFANPSPSPSSLSSTSSDNQDDQYRWSTSDKTKFGAKGHDSEERKQKNREIQSVHFGYPKYKRLNGTFERCGHQSLSNDSAKVGS